MSRKDEYMALREMGMTYAAIAKVYGCSRQNVQQACNRSKRNVVHPERCVYEGLRTWMNENHVTNKELCRRMYGQNLTTNTLNAIRRRMVGRSRWQLDEVNRILDITGLTYEQLFREEPNSVDRCNRKTKISA